MTTSCEYSESIVVYSLKFYHSQGKKCVSLKKEIILVTNHKKPDHVTFCFISHASQIIIYTFRDFWILKVTLLLIHHNLWRLVKTHITITNKSFGVIWKHFVISAIVDEFYTIFSQPIGNVWSGCYFRNVVAMFLS